MKDRSTKQENAKNVVERDCEDQEKESQEDGNDDEIANVVVYLNPYWRLNCLRRSSETCNPPNEGIVPHTDHHSSCCPLAHARGVETDVFALHGVFFFQRKSKSEKEMKKFSRQN